MFRSLKLMLVLLVVSSIAAAQDKKRVAVLDFDYGTVKSEVQAYFGTDQDVGKGISLLLEQKLVQDGKYRVVDRNTMDKILKEQNFSNSDRVDASTAAKIGQILGVSCIIVGSITQFGRDDKHIGGGAGGYGLGKIGLGGLHKNDSKAVVNVTAKMVDVNTAEILAVVTGSGESKRSGFGVGGGGGGWSGGGGGTLDMGSSNFANSILGEAVNAAVANTGQQLDDKASALPTVKVQVSGLVADVTGNTLVLNVGSKGGVNVGDHLTISRKVKDVKDPATGKVIKTITNQLGTATVTEADDSSATATFSGSGAPQVGDVVSNQ
ncbi:MAG TPA: CsgG/HfaB family protein [Terriglobia bacterium]|jgi:curli biogenesis system outer membrane secretion channel CsgG|nr:CsgG/HfaB family protein [Terriglobia bacterium]